MLDQGSDSPVYVVGSTFTGGICSNGSALSSIGVSWSVYNSVFTGNRAIGRGANPARPGTPGGGSGGALYADGNDFRVLLAGTRLTRNHAREDKRSRGLRRVAIRRERTSASLGHKRGAVGQRKLGGRAASATRRRDVRWGGERSAHDREETCL